MQPKTLFLCADDFGLNPAVSAGIIQLVQLQRLSAVSCMVNMPSFNEDVRKLIGIQHQVQVGLHFNLTEGDFLSDSKPCFSLNELLLKTHLRLLKPSFIAKEFNAQLDCYIDSMGSLPNFIDGHQHIHQFPQIRHVILAVYEQRLKQHNPSIRSTYPALTTPNQHFKAFILAITGGRQLSLVLKKRHIPHLPSFAGIYDFAPDADYRALFRQWLGLMSTDTLIMCHPGNESTEKDPIAVARPKELAYFLSDAFLEDCHEFGVLLATRPKSRQQETVNCYET